MSHVDEHEAQVHWRPMLNDQAPITRAIAAATVTPASLLAYDRAESEGLAADPPAEVDEECPF